MLQWAWRMRRASVHPCPPRRKVLNELLRDAVPCTRPPPINPVWGAALLAENWGPLKVLSDPSGACDWAAVEAGMDGWAERRNRRQDTISTLHRTHWKPQRKNMEAELSQFYKDKYASCLFLRLPRPLRTIRLHYSQITWPERFPLTHFFPESIL